MQLDFPKTNHRLLQERFLCDFINDHYHHCG
jgi:hypothetical protein